MASRDEVERLLSSFEDDDLLEIDSDGRIHRVGQVPGAQISRQAGDASQAVELAFVAGASGSFFTAFCTELGRRFGGTVADWAARIRLHRKHTNPIKADLSVEVGDAVTVLELEEGLPDEARLALLDLDL